MTGQGDVAGRLVETAARCGIYDAGLDAWTTNGIHFARCSVCQHTWTHYREASAGALYLAHLAVRVAR